MHKEKIKKIKSDLADGVFVIDALRDTFKGQTALVISAGPSADKWKKIVEQEKHNNPVIICIKQTLNLIDIPCNIHFLNSANLIKYKHEKDTFSIMTRNSKAAPVFGTYDVNFKIMEGFNYKPQYYLAKNQCFECYTLEKTGIYRPIGPGIMHESVLFTLVHMGFNRIVTVGWDIADNNGGNRHFGEEANRMQDRPYLPSNRKKAFEKILNRFKLLWLFKFLGFMRRFVKGWLNYHSGKKANLAGMALGEADIVSQSIPELKLWLKQKKVDLIIKSNSKWMPDE